MRYYELAPMLLNEVQKQAAQAEQQEAQLRHQQEQLSAEAARRTAMQHEFAQLKQQNHSVLDAAASMQAALAELLAKEGRVAMR